MVSNAVIEQRSKPIDIQWDVIYDWIKDGHIELFFIDDASNSTDMFIKNLGCIKIEEFRQSLGLVVSWGHSIISFTPYHYILYYTLMSLQSGSKARGSVELHMWSSLL